MKKTKKGKLFVLLLMVISMLSITVLQVGGADRREAASVGDVIDMHAVTFYHCENIPPEIASQIEKSMLGISDGYTMIQSLFWCWIAHDFANGTIITIQHRTHSTNPRCSETTTSIIFCTRSNCSVLIVTGESTRRISCC